MRPEQILLADKGEEGALQGTVAVTELMGSTEHVHVTAPDQFVLIIPVVDLEAKGALKAGDTIWFKFEKNATHPIFFGRNTNIPCSMVRDVKFPNVIWRQPSAR